MIYRKLSQPEKKKLRESYVKEQKGLCYHCKEPLSGPPSPRVLATSYDPKQFPKGFLDFPVHLHHNHKTGLTIGAVHARCNAYLWLYKGL
jgi:hypothetical protein